MRLRHLLGSAWSAALLAGCSASPEGEADPQRVATITSLSGDVTNGEAVFAMNCLSCHGRDATSGTASQDLPGKAASDPADFASTVLAGEGSMPSLDVLADQDIANVIAYLASLN